jgi:SAM-dependent methyltransferase
MDPQLDAVDLSALKQRMKAMWSAGDFGKMAPFIADEAERFVARLNLQPGTKFLDVACGTGNTAIPAARAGAMVTGVDIAPNSLASAREWAQREGLTAQFDEGDAEELPYPEGQFDVVVSMFGAMFAPRPEKTVAELARVCRSGGLIAMANWTPQGFVGKSFQISSRYAPPPPPGVPAPALWGEESVARERFAGVAASFEAVCRELVFDYPFGPAEVVQFHRMHLGPAKTTHARLDEEGRRQLTAEMDKHYSEHNQGAADHTVIRSQYLDIHVRRK